ncbi:MAG: hypothetical protein QF672_03435 [SAR202 cluster bacterium]|nr:hypothetical protein [SAR202 cluster bacterium]
MQSKPVVQRWIDLSYSPKDDDGGLAWAQLIDGCGSIGAPGFGSAFTHATVSCANGRYPAAR